jgi:heterotetrameric sarcosine oxidase gamma subunit
MPKERACVLDTHCPLDERLAAVGHAGAKGGSALRLGVLQRWQLVQIGTFERQSAGLDALIARVLGSPLPTAADVVTCAGAHRLYRIAADQYWILSPDGALPETLARAVPPDSGSVTRLSDARVRIAIAGAAATALLSKVVSVDLRPRAFAVGNFVQTGLRHTGVLLERQGPESFEIHALRSYAASTWDWLIDAALPYGYDVYRESDREASA